MKGKIKVPYQGLPEGYQVEIADPAMLIIPGDHEVEIISYLTGFDNNGKKFQRKDRLMIRKSLIEYSEKELIVIMENDKKFLDANKPKK